jgi:hypothetical protein
LLPASGVRSSSSSRYLSRTARSSLLHLAVSRMARMFSLDRSLQKH